MTTLGTLILELSAPTTTLQADLRRAEEMVRNTAKAWEIKPTWGIASSLHDEIRATRSILNSGLKGMESDLKGYQLKINVDWGAIDRINSKPIVPVVDDSALTRLNQHLSLKEEHLDRVVSKFANTPIVPNFGGKNNKIEIQADTTKISKSVSNAIEQGFKSAKPNPITGLADTALSPFKSIFRGIFENLGKQLTNPLSKGIAEGLNQSVAGTIGSQALVGEKIGETIATAIKGKIGKSLGREIKDLSTDLLGQENIDREGGSASLESRKRKSAKTKTGAEGLNQERQQVERERIASLAQLEELKAQNDVLENNKTAIGRRIQLNSDRQFRARAVGNKKAQAWLATTDRVLRSGYTDIEAAQADLQVEIAQKEPKIERLALKRDRLTERIDKLSPQQPYSYRQIAEEVTGRKLKDEELPQLLVADARLKKLGGTAAYNATANTISVRRDLYNRIQSGTLDLQGYRETVHELTHGKDAGFGKLSNLREYQAGRVPKQIYSAEEIAYAAPYVAQYSPSQRAKEMSAFAAEQRLAPGLYDRQNRQNALAQFQSDDNFGFGGSRYQKFIAASQSNQKQQLSSLVGMVPTSEIEDLIKIRKQLSEKSSALIAKINQSVGRGSLAPGLEEAIAANIGEFEQFEKILELTKAKVSKATTNESADDPWADNPIGRVANGAKQAASKAGEISRAVGNEIALSRTAFGLAVDGTRRAIQPVVSAAGKVARPIAGAINSGYQIAQGVENAVLPMIPFGREIKGFGKNIALPAAAYAGIGMLPGGAAVQGALGGAMHSALSLPAAGAVEAIGGAVGSAFGSVPMLGGAITSASTALAGSVAEGAVALLTPILAGKAVMGIAGQGARLALPPAKKPDYEYIEAGQKVAQKAIGAAQSMVKVDYQQLPPARERLQLGGREQLQLPASTQPTSEWQAIARARITDIRKKLDSAINNGNKALAQTLYGQFEAQVAEFDRFVKGAAASVGKDKTITNQAVVGKWERIKADRAKRIDAIVVDENESLRAEERPRHLGRPLPPPNYYSTIPDPWAEPRPLGRPLPPPTRQPLGRPLPPPNRFNPQTDGMLPIPELGRVERESTNLNRISPAAGRFDRAYDRANRDIDRSLTQSAQGIGNELERIDRGEPPINKTKSALDKLIGVGKLGLAVFGGYTLLSLGVPAMISLGKATLDTASNFEQLRIKLQASTGSLETGKQRFAAVRAEAQKLGVSQQGALETAARISATTFGTELEGMPSDIFSSQITKIAQARGLSQQQTNSLSLALSQILGKPRVSAEEINQLVESGGMPDARTVAARSMGYTPQQFAKLAESGTGIDSKAFVGKFLSQATSDSLLVKDEALNTQQAKVAKLQSTVENLQVTVGEGISPVFKTGLDVLSGAVDLLNKGMENGSKILIGAAAFAIGKTTAALYQMSAAAMANGTATSMMGASWNSLTALAPGLLKIAGYTALFYALGSTVGVVAKQFNNAGDDIEQAANRISNALAKLEGKKPNIELPKTASDVGGDDWMENIVLGGQRGINKIGRGISKAQQSIIDNPISVGMRKALGINSTGEDVDRATKPVNIVDSKQKESADRVVAIDKLSDVSQKVLQNTAAATIRAQSLKQIDLDLNALNTERSGLFANNEPDARKIADLDARYKAKYLERTKIANGDSKAGTKGLSDSQTIIQDQINTLKGQRDKFDSEIAKGAKSQISKEEYDKIYPIVTRDLKAAEAAQRKLNEAIKSGLDDLAPWTKALEVIATKFDDIATNATVAEQKQSIARNTLRTSGKLTAGQTEYQTSLDRQGSIRTQANQTASTIKELRSALNLKDPNAVANVYKAYGVNDQTSSAQLKVQAERATGMDKEVLSKLAVIKDQEVKLQGLRSQLSDARTEMYNRIERENIEARNYYLGIAKQIDPVGTAFQKAIANVTIESNRLKSKLQGFGNGIFDDFANSVFDLLDSTKNRLNILAQNAAAKKAALDARNDGDRDLAEKGRNAYVPTNGKFSTTTSDPTTENVNQGVKPSTSQSANPKPAISKPISGANSIYGKAGNSGMQKQIDADLSRLNPQQRHNYLNTTYNANGTVDLAPDEWDRKHNPSVFKKGQKFPNQKPIPNADRYPVTVDSPRPLVPSAPRTPATNSATVTRQQTSEVNTYYDKTGKTQKQIYAQTVQKADTEMASLLSEQDMKDLLAARAERRKTRQETRSQRSQQRKQNLAVKKLAPAITIQEKQGLETEDFDINAQDKRDKIEEEAIGFRETAADLKNIIIPLLKNYASGKAPELQKFSKEDRAKFIEQYQQKLKDAQANLKEVEAGANFYTKSLGGLDKRVAAARAKIVEQQRYDNEVTAEQNQIKERDIEIGKINTERADIAQKLPTNQFNETLNAQDQSAELKATQLQLKNERITKQREITDKERKGEYAIGRTPQQVKAYVAGLRAAVDKDIKSKEQNALKRQGLRKDEFNFGVSQKRGEQKVAGGQLDIVGEEVLDRFQAISDKTDSPFANNIALERDRDRKLAVITNRQSERRTKYEAELNKIKGNDPTSAGLRAEVDRQYQQANFQDEKNKEAVSQEYKLSTNERIGQRKSYLYGQQKSQQAIDMEIYDARISSQKMRGQDTRYEEYNSRENSIKADIGQRQFDLNQQRNKFIANRPDQDKIERDRIDLNRRKKAISGDSPEAKAQRELIDKDLAQLKEQENLKIRIDVEVDKIDKASAGLKEIENIKLDNLATEFEELTQTIGNTQKATREVTGDFVFGKSKGFNWQKILSAPFEGIANKSLDSLTSGLFAGLYPQAQAPKQRSEGDWLGGLLGGLLGFAEGGVIGSGRSKADDQLILAQRGEGVITHRGMDILGEHGLHLLNRGLPPLPKFATGGVVGGMNNVSMNLDSNRIQNSGGNTFNFEFGNSGNVRTNADNKRLQKDFEAAVTQVYIKHKRAGLV